MPMVRALACALLAAVVSLAASGCGDCSTVMGPCHLRMNLTGTWSGTSTYINAPFTMILQQRGTSVSGHYEDQKDAGGVSGTATSSSIVLDVTFGDTGIRFTASEWSRNRIAGEVFVAALGGRRFPFEMVR